VPSAVTTSVVLPPTLMFAFSVWDVICGFTHSPTVTVAVVLLSWPQPLLTRTQYEVVALRMPVEKFGEFVPTGFDVSGALPRYHW